VAAVVLVGAQWGDEGKGKITDFLAQKADCVVRYQGGSNAGHTVEVKDEKFMLHLIPSGILYPATLCIVGNGVVVDMEKIIEELAGLQKRGIDTSNLRISRKAPVVLPYHKNWIPWKIRRAKLALPNGVSALPTRIKLTALDSALPISWRIGKSWRTVLKPRWNIKTGL